MPQSVIRLRQRQRRKGILNKRPRRFRRTGDQTNVKETGDSFTSQHLNDEITTIDKPLLSNPNQLIN